MTPEQERKLLDDVDEIKKNQKWLIFIVCCLYLVCFALLIASTCRSEVCDTTYYWDTKNGVDSGSYKALFAYWTWNEDIYHNVPRDFADSSKVHCHPTALDSLRSEVDALRKRVQELEARVFGDGDSIPVLRNRLFIDTTKGPQYIPLHGANIDTLPPDSVWVPVNLTWPDGWIDPRTFGLIRRWDVKQWSYWKRRKR